MIERDPRPALDWDAALQEAEGDGGRRPEKKRFWTEKRSELWKKAAWAGARLGVGIVAPWAMIPLTAASVTREQYRRHWAGKGFKEGWRSLAGGVGDDAKFLFLWEELRKRETEGITGKLAARLVGSGAAIGLLYVADAIGNARAPVPVEVGEELGAVSADLARQAFRHLVQAHMLRELTRIGGNLLLGWMETEERREGVQDWISQTVRAATIVTSATGMWKVGKALGALGEAFFQEMKDEVRARAAATPAATATATGEKQELSLTPAPTDAAAVAATVVPVEPTSTYEPTATKEALTPTATATETATPAPTVEPWDGHSVPTDEQLGSATDTGDGRYDLTGDNVPDYFRSAGGRDWLHNEWGWYEANKDANGDGVPDTGDYYNEPTGFAPSVYKKASPADFSREFSEPPPPDAKNLDGGGGPDLFHGGDGKWYLDTDGNGAGDVQVLVHYYYNADTGGFVFDKVASLDGSLNYVRGGEVDFHPEPDQGLNPLGERDDSGRPRFFVDSAGRLLGLHYGPEWGPIGLLQDLIARAHPDWDGNDVGRAAAVQWIEVEIGRDFGYPQPGDTLEAFLQRHEISAEQIANIIAKAQQ